MEQSKFAVKSPEPVAESRRELAALHLDNIPEKQERISVTAGSAGAPARLQTDSKSLSNNQHTSQETPAAQVPQRVPKDNWDKIAAIAPIISAALIFATGGYCTYTYNQQQIKIQQCQTIEKFIPHLMGNEQTKKAAILALSTLINTETASKFASIFASTGTVSALQTMSQTGTDKDKLIATQALSSALQNLAERESQLTTIEQDYKTAVADKKNNTDNPDTPYNLNKLAQLYTIRGQYTLAEPLLKRSLEIRERVYGPRHPEVVDALKSLAELYQLSGKNELAESTLKRARDIEENPEFTASAKDAAVTQQAIDGSAKSSPAAAPLAVKPQVSGKPVPLEPAAKSEGDKAPSVNQGSEARAEQGLEPVRSEARQP